MYFLNAFLFLTIASASTASIVIWMPSTNFYVPNNFKDGQYPCSKETVVFPEKLLGSVRLESKISVSGFVLPRDGEIIIDKGIEFGADSNVNCSDGYAYYLGNSEKSIASWNQPDVWSSPRFNDATPDAERVPCYDDEVEFPGNTQYVVKLPDRTQYVRGVKIGNESYTTEQFMDRVLQESDQSQVFILNDVSLSRVEVKQNPCRSRAGCPCQKFPLEIDCEAKYCEVPTCLNPIQPPGHCCAICGGVIAFDIDQSFDLMSFKGLVDRVVNSYGADSLEYHIGRLPPHKVQLVIVDKIEYDGTSAEVVNAIDHQMEKHWVRGAKYAEISGSPLYKAGLGGKIFISMFFLVVLSLTGIYVYYYKLADKVDLRFPMRRSVPAVFSRFQTRTESVVSLTRRDSGVPLGRDVGTSFRNPLYDSARRRVQVEEIVDEE